jgi:hypothetical protein
MAEHVVPDAVESVHAQILDRDAPGDGNLAVRVLEGVGVLGKDAGPQTVVYDERTQMAIALLAPPRAHAQPRPALDDSGSVPTSGEASNCAGNATQAHSQPAQAEPMPEPAQPGPPADADDAGRKERDVRDDGGWW